MALKATLVIDVGNSSNRMLLSVGDFKGMERETKFVEFSNKFATTNRVPKRINSETYNTENTVMFKVPNTKIGTAVIDNDVIMHGLYPEREYSSTNMKPSSSLDKFNNKHTIYSIVTAMYKATQSIADTQSVSIDFKALMETIIWDITVLLPPDQADKQLTFREDIKNLKEVSFVYPDVNVNLNINSVNIQQEGYTAFFGAFFNRKTKMLKAKYKHIIQAGVKTLILDIGAGTTDFMIIEGGRAIDSSKLTINKGGNNIKALAAKMYVGEEDLRVDKDAFDEAVITGVIHSGLREIDVVDYVNDAKYKIGQELIKEIQEYLVTINFEPSSIHNILIVGGGSMRGDNPAIEPISKKMINEFKTFAPDMNLIDLNDLEKDDDYDELNTPRTVNLIGAGILTDIRDFKAIEAKKQGS